MLKYLSPSSLRLFESDPEGYYVKYLTRQGRYEQTLPMAIGSAFDAALKCYLYGRFIGDGNPAYDCETLFQSQVDEALQDEAWIAGQKVYDAYHACGAAARLEGEIAASPTEPQFEITAQGNIEGVELLGKPDLIYRTPYHRLVVVDFKVNGYLSPRTVSPRPGYLVLRPALTQHKKTQPYLFDDQYIAKSYLEEIDVTWADQLPVYAWCLGERVGSENVLFGIEQITGGKDNIRAASFRHRCSTQYQRTLLQRFKTCWNIVNSDHFFRDLTKEESLARCHVLKGTATVSPDFWRRHDGDDGTSAFDFHDTPL